jgi:hypothetical protein
MWPFPARRQHNSASLDIGVQGIPCPNVESAAERTGKNNLPFGGNLGLHGKTILPDFMGILNRPTTGVTGRWATGFISEEPVLKCLLASAALR